MLKNVYNINIYSINNKFLIKLVREKKKLMMMINF